MWARWLVTREQVNVSASCSYSRFYLNKLLLVFSWQFFFLQHTCIRDYDGWWSRTAVMLHTATSIASTAWSRGRIGSASGVLYTWCIIHNTTTLDLVEFMAFWGKTVGTFVHRRNYVFISTLWFTLFGGFPMLACEWIMECPNSQLHDVHVFLPL
jgi:hypothetical protein